MFWGWTPKSSPPLYHCPWGYSRSPVNSPKVQKDLSTNLNGWTSFRCDKKGERERAISFLLSFLPLPLMRSKSWRAGWTVPAVWIRKKAMMWLNLGNLSFYCMVGFWQWFYWRTINSTRDLKVSLTTLLYNSRYLDRFMWLKRQNEAVKLSSDIDGCLTIALSLISCQYQLRC